jgi:hypothetical protein
MTHKYKCPICGTTVHVSTLDGSYPINLFNVHGLGKAKGFSFEKVEDPSFVARIKAKISVLYHQFFGFSLPVHETFKYHVNPSYKVREKISFKLGG